VFSVLLITSAIRHCDDAKIEKWEEMHKVKPMGKKSFKQLMMAMLGFNAPTDIAAKVKYALTCSDRRKTTFEKVTDFKVGG